MKSAMLDNHACVESTRNEMLLLAFDAQNNLMNAIAVLLRRGGLLKFEGASGQRPHSLFDLRNYLYVTLQQPHTQGYRYHEEAWNPRA